jgi:hypothetical protein
MRLIRALILFLCLLLVATVGVAVLDSGSDEPPLREHVGQVLEGRSAPPAYRRCLDAQLRRRLSQREDAQGAAGRLPASTRAKLRDSGLFCARRLITSGRFTAREVIAMQARLRPPGF